MTVDDPEPVVSEDRGCVDMLFGAATGALVVTAGRLVLATVGLRSVIM